MTRDGMFGATSILARCLRIARSSGCADYRGGCSPPSLKKKFRDRAFAAGVDREEVEQAAKDLEVDLKAHVQFVIEAMRTIAGDLGLDGETA